MNISEFISAGLPVIASLYDRAESLTVLETMICDILGLNFRLTLDDLKREITDEELGILHQCLEELRKGKPVQYVTGIAYFMDIRLHVNEKVLIPRPETEELVEVILRTFAGRENIAAIDIGCGSGCIAIQLAKSIPGAHVTAVDTSKEALMLTTENAQLNKVKVKTEMIDVLTDYDAVKGSYDLIVSNPPYIHPTESNEVDEQVLKFEPHLALFTPHDDVLIFYRKILEIASKTLKPEGAIYFEVNPAHVDKLESLVVSRGWRLRKHVDISGKTRIFEIGKIS